MTLKVKKKDSGNGAVKKNPTRDTLTIQQLLAQLQSDKSVRDNAASNLLSANAVLVAAQSTYASALASFTNDMSNTNAQNLLNANSALVSAQGSYSSALTAYLNADNTVVADTVALSAAIVARLPAPNPE